MIISTVLEAADLCESERNAVFWKYPRFDVRILPTSAAGGVLSQREKSRLLGIRSDRSTITCITRRPLARGMQRLPVFGRAWTKFPSVRDLGDKCPGLLLSRTREIGRRSFKSRVSSVLEDRLKAKDAIPRGFALVYRGGLDNYIHLAYGTSAIIFVFSALNLCHLARQDKPVNFSTDADDGRFYIIRNYTELFVLYAALFGMLLSLGSISRKYVLRMYYNESTQTYRAVRCGYLPGATRTHDFKAATLRRLRKKSLVPWLNVQYKSQGEKFLIMDEGFRTNADYDRMFTDSA